jgi:hypothetical protein
MGRTVTIFGRADGLWTVVVVGTITSSIAAAGTVSHLTYARYEHFSGQQGAHLALIG